MIGITKPFKNLDTSKQKRILNAALKEFAENGFEQASTNQIVKNAGIGKGMLFYYFKNKKELYYYLIDYAINIMTMEFINHVDTQEADFIERFRQIARVKIAYYYGNPNVSNFISAVYLNEEVELPTDLKTRLKELEKLGYSMIFENIDKTLFRNDVDVDKSFQLIRWSIEGYQNELINEFKGRRIDLINLDPYWDEFYQYLDILKTTFCKIEGDEK